MHLYVSYDRQSRLIISLNSRKWFAVIHSRKWLVIILQGQCVICTVRTECLYIILTFFMLNMAVSWLRQLFISLTVLVQSQAGQCMFVAWKVAPGEVSHWVLQCVPANVIPWCSILIFISLGQRTLQMLTRSHSSLKYYMKTVEKRTLTLLQRLQQTSHYGYRNLDETYKMDRSSFWRHGVATMRSIPCPLPLDNKLETCTAHRDGGHALSAGTPYQNRRHESCPSEDSSGRAHRHTPSVAGSCECLPSVQNPPTEHNNKQEQPILQSKETERERDAVYIVWTILLNVCPSVSLVWQ